MSIFNRASASGLSLGAAIRARRLSLGLSQEQLADRISAKGNRFRQSDVSRLELDRVGRPSVSRLQAIAQALDLTNAELLARAGFAPFELGLDPGIMSFQANQRRLEVELRRAQKNHQPLALILIRVQLTCPQHRANEVLLNELLDALRYGMRESDIITRFADASFLIMLLDTTRITATRVCERLHAMLERVATELAVPTQITIGLAGYPDDGANLDDLIQGAARSVAQHIRQDVIDAGTAQHVDDPSARQPAALRRLPEQGQGSHV